MAFSGQLYQLHSSRPIKSGSYVAVNGPHDTFGVILSAKQETDGRWLNLIRGVKQRQSQHPAAQF